MKLAQPIITQLPLQNIWNEQGTLIGSKTRELNRDKITALLRKSQIYFVVADVGFNLEWIPIDACYKQWKTEIKQHIMDPAAQKVYVEDFPEQYCYRASEWQTNLDHPVVVLEKWH